MRLLADTNQGHFVRCCTIIVLAVLSCIGCIFGDFVFDDSEAIINNKDVIDSPITNIFSNDFWGTKLTNKYSHKSYRPLTVLTFRLNYWISGRLIPWSFHAINTVLHVCVCLLLLKVYVVILGQGKINVALTACWLFSTHPIHVESVCGIVGRADLLAATFFILSFLCYAASSEQSRTAFWRVFGLVASIALAGFALFSKEHGITVLGFNVIYELLAVQKINVRRILKCNIEEFSRIEYPRVLTLLIGAAILIYLRCNVMDFKGPTFQKVDNPASFQDDWVLRTLSLHYVTSLNFWLLLCPDWLCFDWSMGCVPLIEQLIDKRVMAPLCYLAALILIIRHAVLNLQFEQQRNVLLSIALMVIPFLPASNLLFRVGFVIAERVLYIPSAGFCLLVALGIERLFARKDLHFLLGLLIMVFMLKSHVRSLDWRTESSLFSSALRVCPNNAKVRYNVAKSAADRGDAVYAIQEYREAIRLYPEYDQALNNLANMLKSRGELAEAERLLRKALKIRPDFPAAWMNLGIVLAGMKRYSEAEKCYQNALRLRKFNPDCYYNIGNLYLEQNQLNEAEKSWRSAIQLKPKMVVAWNNLIMLKDNHGNHIEAVELGMEALRSAGEDPSLHFNIANALGKLSKFPEAEEHFKKAISLDGKNALYYVNLGVTYHRWHKYDDAEKAYLTALTLNPKLNSAKLNYQSLQKKKMRESLPDDSVIRWNEE